MPIRPDVNTGCVVVASVKPQSTATAAVNGSSVDMRNYPGHRVLAVGSVGNWTDGSLLFAVEDSADNSSFAALAPVSGAFSAIAADDTTQTVAVVPVPGRPYLRIVTSEATAIGTALPFSGHFVLIPPFGAI